MIMKNRLLLILISLAFVLSLHAQQGYIGANTRTAVSSAIPGDNVLRFYRMAIPVTRSAYETDFTSDYNSVLAFWHECEEYMNRIYVPIGFCFDVVEDSRLVQTKSNLIDESINNAPSFGTELVDDAIGSDSYDIAMWVTYRPKNSENTGLSVQYGAYSHSTKGSGYAMADKWVVAHEVGHLLGATHTTAGEGSLMEQGGDYLSYPSIKMIREGTMSRNSAYYSDETRTQLVGNNAGGNYVYGVKLNNNAPQFDEQLMKDVYEIPQGGCLYIPVYATDADSDKLNYAAYGCGKDNVGGVTENDFLDIGFIAPQESSVIEYTPSYSADIYYDDYYYPVAGTDITNLYPGNYVVSLLVNDVPQDGDYSYEAMKKNPFYSNYSVWEAVVEVVAVNNKFEASLSPAKENYSAGETVTVRWNADNKFFTAGSKLRVTMSCDYGKTFEYVLAESVPACNGSCSVELPDVNVGLVDVDFVTAVRSMRGGIIRVEEIGGAAYTLTPHAPENGGGFIVTGATTGVGELSSDLQGGVYDLQGRKIEFGKLPAGVYIRNGKKMLVDSK